ncbi:hypothetical protein CROQUDRAFT_51139, partial [Cronartium quercuum f. sp. fusiforme G11]
LLYAGYIPSSPQKPWTAFSIPLVQLHHQLWQNSALPTKAFVNGITVFIND